MIQETLANATRALAVTMSLHSDASSQEPTPHGVDSIAPCDDASARLQAELLLAHTLGHSRAHLLARLDETLDATIAAQYAALIARRAQDEPLAYILGHQEFCQIDFLVDRRVLIPRHETELLVALALEHQRARNRAAPMIVDVGTGSGALALTLAHHLRNARVIATDISSDALAVAQLNARRLNLESRVEFLQGDLLEPLTEPFDLLVANLPYIPTPRYDRLPREIHEFEPRLALDGGFDGLDLFRRLLPQMESRAAEGAVAFLEISEEQGYDARELVQRELPRASVTLHRDLEGLDRVIEIHFVHEGHEGQ